MTDRELEAMLEQAEENGIEQGIKLMQLRMLLACEAQKPIELSDGRLYWIQNDVEHLRQVMDSIK